MSLLSHYSVDELKLVYRVLHAALPENPELMDSLFLEELQSYLQTCAKSEGVDVSLHAQWAAWLGGSLLRGL